MSQPIYLDQLVKRLAAEWKPPHHRRLFEAPSGIPIQEDVLRAVLESAFFASLRTEEGHHYDLALVLVRNPLQLTELRPPWRVHPLVSPLKFDADRLTKLAPALQGGKRFLVVRIDDSAPVVVGVGDAPEAFWFLSWFSIGVTAPYSGIEPGKSTNSNLTSSPRLIHQKGWRVTGKEG